MHATKHYLLLWLFSLALSPYLNAQVEDLGLDELMHVNVEAEARDIPLVPAEANTGTTVNLGLIIPQSKYPNYAEEVLQAARLAVKEINAEGLLPNKELLLIPADDAGSAELAAKRAQKLIDEYNVAALIGPTSSARVLYVAEQVTIPSNTVMVAPDVTANAISLLDDNQLVWRMALPNREQTRVAARYAANELHKKTAGLLFVDNIYGQGIKAHFTEAFEEAGGQIVSSIGFSNIVDAQTYDWRPKLIELFRKKPDLIYLISNPTEGAAVTQAIAKGNFLSSDYSPRFMTNEANKGPDFLQQADPEIISGMVGTSTLIPQNKAFTKRYKKAYISAPQFPEVANTYDAIYLLAYSIVSAEDYTSDHIKTHLQAVSSQGEPIGVGQFAKGKQLIQNGGNINYEGASGSVEFNEQGDVTQGTYEIWQIENGAYQTLERIEVK